jgi:undecaprenyl-diphosphatase
MKAGKILAIALIHHLAEIELTISTEINKACNFNFIKALFKLISRLGDGVFWYSLIVCLAIYYGEKGFLAAGHMLLAAGISLIIYKLVKSKTSRIRPFEFSNAIMKGTIALDRYSFPSGHTLQAVCFTTVALPYFPHLAILLVPFTLLVALSRVLLGLHYPTDVIAGAMIGYTIAKLTFLI